jgi:hypothetical protein
MRGRTPSWLLLTVAAIGAVAMIPAAAGARLRTRACGFTTHPGLPAAVRATRTVSCRQARRIMVIVNGESRDLRCYSGPGRFHPCTVEGFHCTLHNKPNTDIGTARCTKGRTRLITGQT